MIRTSSAENSLHLPPQKSKFGSTFRSAEEGRNRSNSSPMQFRGSNGETTDFVAPNPQGYSSFSDILVTGEKGQKKLVILHQSGIFHNSTKGSLYLTNNALIFMVFLFFIFFLKRSAKGFEEYFVLSSFFDFFC